MGMPDLHMDGVLSEDNLGCIEEEDVDEADDIGEMEDYDMMDEERSLSRSVSQMTTRGETTQPDEDIQNDDRVVVTAPRKAQCTEDDDFMAALDRMVAENINERGKEKPPAVDISIPWQVKVSLKKPVDGISDKNCLGDALGGELGGALAVAEASSTAMASSPPASGEGEPTMAFYLMTRKGNKAQFKNLAVPTDSELAQNLRNREMAERVEKERVKKLTLDFNERQEEEIPGPISSRESAGSAQRQPRTKR